MAETNSKFFTVVEQQVVKSVLGSGMSSGITTKQISTSCRIEEKIVKKIIDVLDSKGEIVRTGRGLWILEKYVDITEDILFVSPEEYFSRIESQSPRTKISKFSLPITFNSNHAKRFHSWSPYVQGFSSEFVDYVIDKHELNQKSFLLDPFAGTGTAMVQAKMRGVNSVGIEMMPLMSFLCSVKLQWDFSLVQKLKKKKQEIKLIKNHKPFPNQPFLRKTPEHFSTEILENLLKIKQYVYDLEDENDPTNDFLKLALASILIPCSRLTRSPSLGYPPKEKLLEPDLPFELFEKKISKMIDDLEWAKHHIKKIPESIIINDDSRKVESYGHKIDVAITSPPYINGMDYVINYKIESVWLDFAKSYRELKNLKDSMVVCDNVSKHLYQNYIPKYKDEWLDEISNSLEKRIEEKGTYRRNDMHNLVRKYFDDLYPVLENVYNNLKDNGKFYIVIGDSLIAGIYIPADIIVGRIGMYLGYKLDNIMIARTRFSGQRHDFKLRESIVVLKK